MKALWFIRTEKGISISYQEELRIKVCIVIFLFHQVYKDVEVYGVTITLGKDHEGNTISLQGSFYAWLIVNTSPRITKEEIVDIMENRGYTVNGESKLYIYTDDTKPILVWCTEGYDSTGEINDLLMNANTGEEVFANSLCQTENFPWVSQCYRMLMGRL